MRTKPYSKIGIKRVPCARCGAPGFATWGVCALNSRAQRVLCREHDVELNELITRWVYGDAKEAELEVYRKRVLGE